MDFLKKIFDLFKQLLPEAEKENPTITPKDVKEKLEALLKQFDAEIQTVQEEDFDDCKKIRDTLEQQIKEAFAPRLMKIKPATYFIGQVHIRIISAVAEGDLLNQLREKEYLAEKEKSVTCSSDFLERIQSFVAKLEKKAKKEYISLESIKESIDNFKKELITTAEKVLHKNDPVSANYEHIFYYGITKRRLDSILKIDAVLEETINNEFHFTEKNNNKDTSLKFITSIKTFISNRLDKNNNVPSSFFSFLEERVEKAINMPLEEKLTLYEEVTGEKITPDNPISETDVDDIAIGNNFLRSLGSDQQNVRKRELEEIKKLAKLFQYSKTLPDEREEPAHLKHCIPAWKEFKEALQEGKRGKEILPYWKKVVAAENYTAEEAEQELYQLCLSLGQGEMAGHIDSIIEGISTCYSQQLDKLLNTIINEKPTKAAIREAILSCASYPNIDEIFENCVTWLPHNKKDVINLFKSSPDDFPFCREDGSFLSFESFQLDLKRITSNLGLAPENQEFAKKIILEWVKLTEGGKLTLSEVVEERKKEALSEYNQYDTTDIQQDVTIEAEIKRQRQEIKDIKNILAILEKEIINNTLENLKNKNISDADLIGDPRILYISGALAKIVEDTDMSWDSAEGQCILTNLARLYNLALSYDPLSRIPDIQTDPDDPSVKNRKDNLKFLKKFLATSQIKPETLKENSADQGPRDDTDKPHLSLESSPEGAEDKTNKKKKQPGSAVSDTEGALQAKDGDNKTISLIQPPPQRETPEKDQTQDYFIQSKSLPWVINPKMKLPQHFSHPTMSFELPADLTNAQTYSWQRVRLTMPSLKQPQLQVMNQAGSYVLQAAANGEISTMILNSAYAPQTYTRPTFRIVSGDKSPTTPTMVIEPAHQWGSRVSSMHTMRKLPRTIHPATMVQASNFAFPAWVIINHSSGKAVAILEDYGLDQQMPATYTTVHNIHALSNAPVEVLDDAYKTWQSVNLGQHWAGLKDHMKETVHSLEKKPETAAQPRIPASDDIRDLLSIAGILTAPPPEHDIPQSALDHGQKKAQPTSLGSAGQLKKIDLTIMPTKASASLSGGSK